MGAPRLGGGLGGALSRDLGLDAVVLPLWDQLAPAHRAVVLELAQAGYVRGLDEGWAPGPERIDGRWRTGTVRISVITCCS